MRFDVLRHSEAKREQVGSAVGSNWSLDTETQLQAAASPHVLRSGQLQR
jgi:hypothetical protein